MDCGRGVVRNGLEEGRGEERGGEGEEVERDEEGFVGGAGDEEDVLRKREGVLVGWFKGGGVGEVPCWCSTAIGCDCATCRRSCDYSLRRPSPR